MRTDGEVFRFGSFELHSKRRHLICGRERISLRDAPANILDVFVSHPGEVLSFDVLAPAGWGEEEVTPNSVSQAVLRRDRRVVYPYRSRKAVATPAPTPIVSEPPTPEAVVPESPDTAQSGPESANPIAPAL